MRARLFAAARRAVTQYTLLLVLLGVAVFKSVCLPFLAAAQLTELASLAYLANKLRALAGELRCWERIGWDVLRHPWRVINIAMWS